ncbi:clotting factor G beta subunit-like [Uloborus diversus]|uniref:clotting factor G beta subunit-like n=1 Tax=Uloborus diversus TaxID=327109 RepID=UPI00240A3CD4|nr:clotting factor G beta subunit-like [Uloborus diversus]
MLRSVITVLGLTLWICIEASTSSDRGTMLQEYLRWNFTHMNPTCTSAGGGRNPCQDVRICRFAAAALAMKGWPTLCGWVGKGVPKVCCGMPLVLGEKLMKQIDEEKARKRECGTTMYSTGTSETEKKFFEIKDSLLPVDTSDSNKYDPPLDLSSVPMVSPVGGRASRQGDFPWMVSIRKRGEHWCGGSLVDRVHILSAAHCFVTKKSGPNPEEYTVHVGNIHVDEGHPFNVVKITIHPGYQDGIYYNDLAMLTLDKEILTPMIAHICLPSPDLDLTGKNTTLLGWGDTSFGGKQTPILHIVDDLPVVPNAQCRKSYARVGIRNVPQGITEDMLCAGLSEGGKDACQADSGGPLMYKQYLPNLKPYHPAHPWVLVGVVSFGYLCGEPGYPGVYTRVSSHLDWILENMNK